MAKQESNHFWPGFTDLMTSLFFVMMVLFIFFFLKLKAQLQEEVETVKKLKNQVEIFNMVQENLKPLREDKSTFRYDKEYRRYQLAFDIRFRSDKYTLSNEDVVDWDNTERKIKRSGAQLKKLIKDLKLRQEQDEKLKDVSYLLVISGYASDDHASPDHNYKLSYRRAFHLYQYWQSIGIDFNEEEYSEIVELHIAGNGVGGIGRLENEVDNQRFLINIIPKIDDLDASGEEIEIE